MQGNELIMRKFINIADIDKKDLRLILDNAKSRKEKRSDLNKNAIDSDAPLEGKILIIGLPGSGKTT